MPAGEMTRAVGRQAGSTRAGQASAAERNGETKQAQQLSLAFTYTVRFFPSKKDLSALGMLRQ